MTSSFGLIQQAIYDTLTGDSTLMSKITGVFDWVLENQDYPYVTIGETTSVDWSTYDSFGEEATATLHIWSRYLGFAEITSIMDDLNRLLVRQTLSISGYMDVGVFYDYADTIILDDGLTRHGVVRYRLLVLSS